MTTLRNRLAFSLSCLLLATCGGGSKNGGGDPVAICKAGCATTVSLCTADAGGMAEAGYLAMCEARCTNSVSAGQTCSNASAIIAALQACQSSTTCAAYTTCSASVPGCIGGSGTGGSQGTGTGGGSGAGTGGRAGGGTGGAGGAASPTACVDLLTCCNATTNTTAQAACMAQYPAVMAMGNEACAMALTQAHALMLCP